MARQKMLPTKWVALASQCQPHQLPDLREPGEHWDLTDISENWAWHPLHELMLMETLKEGRGNCFM